VSCAPETDSIYGIRPAKHAPQLHKEQAIPPDELVKRCQEWLALRMERDAGAWYEAAMALQEGLCFDAAEVNALALEEFPSDLHNYRGLFMSAAHNSCEEQIITYDLETPWLHGLGYRCRKTLVNKGELGNLFGWNASGYLVNLGKVGSSGHNFTGTFINLGLAGDIKNNEGVVINAGSTRFNPYGEMGKCSHPQGILVDLHRCWTPLEFHERPVLILPAERRSVAMGDTYASFEGSDVVHCSRREGRLTSQYTELFDEKIFDYLRDVVETARTRPEGLPIDLKEEILARLKYPGLQV
jgi:hypothetical protein